jgi:hypothetical protein
MIEHVFEIERKRAARDIRMASDQLRELGRQAAPGVWQGAPGERGTIRLLAREEQEIAVLTGIWAPGTARYLTTMAPDTSYLLAELMWLTESMVRKGELPSRVQTALVTLAQAIRPD